MKPFPFLLLTGGILLSASACSNSARNGSTQSEEHSYDVLEKAALRLPLDSTTTQTTQYMQLVNDSTLAFLNKPTSEICLYSLQIPECKAKIKIHKDGPNAVSSIDAFYIQAFDSIWLYAAWGRKAFLIDSKGTLLDSFTLPPTDETGSTEHSVSPYPQTTTPYIVRNGMHFFQGMNDIASANRLAGASLVYDRTGDRIKTGSPYPAVYGAKEEIQNRWSTFGERQTYSHVTPDDKVITSFPASDSIYLWDTRSDRLTAYQADFSSRPEITSSVGTDRESSLRNYVNGFQYGAILYDPYNNLYYRLFRSGGDTDTKDLTNSLLHKPLGVIVLDSDLNKLGEVILPDDGYYPTHAFVNSEGLHINTDSDDDDFMTFKVFKIHNQ